MIVGKAELITYTWKEKEQIHYYTVTYHSGLFMTSSSYDFVAKAVGQLDNPDTRGSTVFEKANKTATENIDINIYLNHKTLPRFAAPVFSNSFMKRLNGSSLLAEWTEIDLTQKNNELFLNGFSFTGDSLQNYLGIF